MPRRLHVSILSLILILILMVVLMGFLGCSPTGTIVKTAPAWLDRDPIMPGYLYAIGKEDGGANAGQMAAQHARDILVRQLQPHVLGWMEAYVVDHTGALNEDQSFRLKQLLPEILDEIILATQIEDEYEKDGHYWVLLKLQEELAQKMVKDKLDQEKSLLQ